MRSVIEHEVRGYYTAILVGGNAARWFDEIKGKTKDDAATTNETLAMTYLLGVLHATRAVMGEHVGGGKNQFEDAVRRIERVKDFYLDGEWKGASPTDGTNEDVETRGGADASDDTSSDDTSSDERDGSGE